MTKEDKELLIKEISSRLPYGVKAKVYGWDEEKGEVEVPLRIYSINTDEYVYFETNNYDVNYLAIDACLLYLRPMSNMTEEEESTYEQLIKDIHYKSRPSRAIALTDWLNAQHFDYRGLIEKGLAIKAPDDMYGKEEQQ